MTNDSAGGFNSVYLQDAVTFAVAGYRVKMRVCSWCLLARAGEVLCRADYCSGRTGQACIFAPPADGQDPDGSGRFTVVDATESSPTGKRFHRSHLAPLRRSTSPTPGPKERAPGC